MMMGVWVWVIASLLWRCTNNQVLSRRGLWALGDVSFLEWTWVARRLLNLSANFLKISAFTRRFLDKKSGVKLNLGVARHTG